MATFIKPYVDKENPSSLNSSTHRNIKSTKNAFRSLSRIGTAKANSNITPKVFDNAVFSAPRKALGNLSNIKTKSSETKQVKKSEPYVDSPRPVPIKRLFAYQKLEDTTKNLSSSLEKLGVNASKESITEEYPDTEFMPEAETVEDNYDDIWPIKERLTLSEMRRLKTWKPVKPSVYEICFEEEKLSPAKLEPVTALWTEDVPTRSDRVAGLDEDSLFEDESLESIDIPEIL